MYITPRRANMPSQSTPEYGIATLQKFIRAYDTFEDENVCMHHAFVKLCHNATPNHIKQRPPVRSHVLTLFTFPLLFVFHFLLLQVLCIRCIMCSWCVCAFAIMYRPKKIPRPFSFCLDLLCHYCVYSLKYIAWPLHPPHHTRAFVSSIFSHQPIPSQSCAVICAHCMYIIYHAYHLRIYRLPCNIVRSLSFALLPFTVFPRVP